MTTSIMNLPVGRKVFGFITRTLLLILLVLITCTCSGLKLTSGHQTFGSQTDYSSYSGKLVKQIYDPMECVTLRTDVLDFHLWHRERWLTWQPYPATHGMGYYQSLGLMPRRCLPIKWYPYQLITPSFSNRPRTEWTVQRPNLPTVYPQVSSPVVSSPPPPPTKPPRTNYEGLDTTIDWKNTGDNSYDGEKLKLLVHDESGKWEKPNNILNNWRVTKTTLRLGSRVIGKCMMGSTSNSLDKGGRNFKKLYDDSDVTLRETAMDRLAQDYIVCSYLWNGTTKDTLILMAYLYSIHQKNPLTGPDGGKIKLGVIEYWDNEVEGLKDDQDGLNEFYRQFPRTELNMLLEMSQNNLYLI